MSQPDDFLIRKQALDTCYSYAVSAPAGSGKTGLLTQRFLALLGQCEQPEHILAITFTKKAAAEMQHRIMSALVTTENALNANQAPPESEYEQTTWELARVVLQRDKAFNWQLLSLPNRLRITTIDSFCRTLSQQAPLVNGIGNIPDMLDSADADQAYLHAVRQTINSVEDDSDLRDDLIRLINHFNNNHRTIETLLVNLLKRRDQWLPSIIGSKNQRHALEENLCFTIKEQLKQLHKSLLPFSGELIELADFAAQRLSESHTESEIVHCLGIASLPETDHREIKLWQALVELLLTSKNQFRKTVNKNCGFPATDKTSDKETNATNSTQKKRMQNLLVEMAKDKTLLHQLMLCRHLPDAYYDDKQWQLLDSLSRILLLLTARLNIVFQQLGKTDYIAITHAALNALGEEDNPSDLALLLDYRIQHILIDEFQDTSLPQLALLQKLVAGWQADDNKSLFVVGDAMQSCYGFRDANVGIFLALRQYGIGSLPIKALDLEVNFRSHAPIVDWCNQIFSQLFPQQDTINEGAVKYRPAIAIKAASDNQTVQTHIITSEERLQHREFEANRIADKILMERKHNPENTIAILVKNRGQVKVISEALQEKAIDFRATDLNRLNTNMLVQDLLSLTRALLYPQDTLAWLALLRAPWCGLGMEDLLQIAATRKKIEEKEEQKKSLSVLLLQNRNSITLSETGSKLLSRFCGVIEDAFSQQGRYSLADWIEQTYFALGGDALFVDTDDELAVNAFFSCLRHYQTGANIQNWDLFTSAIGKLYKRNTETISEKTINENESGQNGSTKPVEIMTIHKSKGLEFDTVFIPGIDIGMRSDEQELIAWMDYLDSEQHARLLISPVHESTDEYDSIHRFIRLQQKHKQLLEADRLFYVGCTRAIKRLYLFAQAVMDNKTEDIKVSNNNLLARLWPMVKEEAYIHQVEKDQQALSTINHDHPSAIIRLNEHWQALPNEDNQLLKQYRLYPSYDDIEDDNIADDQALQQRYQRYFGQVLHSALEEIARTGIEMWTKADVLKKQTLWQIKLQDLGMTQALAKTYSQKINQTLLSLLESTLALWLFSNQHSDAHNEYVLWSTIGSNHETGFQESVIDRTFIDQTDTTRWIVDYKSSEPDKNQALEIFLAEETALYRGQLLRYARLFKGQPEPLRCALYFPLMDYLHEIDIQ